jgi:hypothetical protein
MQTTPSCRATDWSREGPRTLIAKDGAVWIWPGIPLAMEQDGAIQPLPRRWIRSWITALHGFEAQDARLEPALTRASAYLTVGDEGKAQQALDLAKIDRLSPEGTILMRAVAEELGIAPLAMAVGTRSLPWGIGNLGVQIAQFRRFGGAARAFEKADDPDQPRWPKGAPDSQGGRYAPGNAGSDSGNAETETPRIGHNGGPPLDDEPDAEDNAGPAPEDMPDIPENEPDKRRIINQLIKGLVKWLITRGVAEFIPGVGEALFIIDAASWIVEYMPYIQAYFDKPRTLMELNDAASQPEAGYDIHHIVEQTPARNEGHTNDAIEAPENRVRIPTLKHWEITGWYNRPNPDYGGMTPRRYLRGKSWDERRRVGLEALERAGILIHGTN